MTERDRTNKKNTHTQHKNTPFGRHESQHTSVNEQWALNSARTRKRDGQWPLALTCCDIDRAKYEGVTTV